MNTLSRSALLGAGSAIALVGVPLMTTFVEAAQKADADDIAALNAAIELERAAIKAYTDGAPLLKPATLVVAKGFLADHTAHRDALMAAVRAAGAVPTEKTASITYPTLATEIDVLRFAEALERKAAATYLSVVPEFKDRRLAEAAAKILGVETTHVAILTQALGEPRPYASGFVG